MCQVRFFIWAKQRWNGEDHGVQQARFLSILYDNIHFQVATGTMPRRSCFSVSQIVYAFVHSWNRGRVMYFTSNEFTWVLRKSELAFNFGCKDSWVFPVRLCWFEDFHLARLGDFMYPEPLKLLSAMIWWRVNSLPICLCLWLLDFILASSIRVRGLSYFASGADNILLHLGHILRIHLILIVFFNKITCVTLLVCLLRSFKWIWTSCLSADL